MFCRSSRATASPFSRVPLECLLAVFELLALHRQLLAEPVRCFLRGEELVLEVLIDVLLRKLVGHGGSPCRVRRREPQVHQAAIADGRDHERFQERVDRARLSHCFARVGGNDIAGIGGEQLHDPLRRTAYGAGHTEGPLAFGVAIQFRRVPQSQAVDRPPGQPTALQNVDLSLVVVLLGQKARLGDLLELHDVWLGRVEEQLHAAFVHGRRDERINDHAREH